MPTQNEYNVSKQNRRTIYGKIYLLNNLYQVVDELSGVIIGTPSFSNNASSDIRRTCSLDIVVTDSSFDIAFGNKIWLDKYINVEIGIEDIHTGVVEYTNMGIYMINNPNRVYNATTNTLTVEGLDLMAKMTGLRGGKLINTYVIPQGSNVRTSIISVIEQFGFTNYVVEECTQIGMEGLSPISTPNEIRVEMGGTGYDILKQLRDIYPQYQMYFDVDGTFRYNQIPNGTGEPIVADDDILLKLLDGYNINTDFENVKNAIAVYGKTHDIKYYSNTTTLDVKNLTLTIPSITSLRDNLKIGFTSPSNVSGYLTINLNSYGAKPLSYETVTSISLPTLKGGVYYVAKYQSGGDYWMFMGEVTPLGYATEGNPDSPFYINGSMGFVPDIFSGGEYDNIYTSTQAEYMAKWKLYNLCRVQDSITITILPLYWLDVNQLIEITLPNKQGIEETNKYIIKQINTGFGVNEKQTITAMKYYSYYA